MRTSAFLILCMVLGTILKAGVDYDSLKVPTTSFLGHLIVFIMLFSYILSSWALVLWHQPIADEQRLVNWVASERTTRKDASNVVMWKSSFEVSCGARSRG